METPVSQFRSNNRFKAHLVTMVISLLMGQLFWLYLEYGLCLLLCVYMFMFIVNWFPTTDYNKNVMENYNEAVAEFRIYSFWFNWCQVTSHTFSLNTNYISSSSWASPQTSSALSYPLYGWRLWYCKNKMWSQTELWWKNPPSEVSWGNFLMVGIRTCTNRSTRRIRPLKTRRWSIFTCCWKRRQRNMGKKSSSKKHIWDPKQEIKLS